MRYNSGFDCSNFQPQDNNIAEGVHKFSEYCDSLNHVDFRKPNSIFDSFSRASDFGNFCNDINFQEGLVLRQVGVFALVLRFFGCKL